MPPSFTSTTPKPDDATWAVEQFTAYWADPAGGDATVNLSPDIVGHWPDGRTLRGLRDYLGRLAALGERIPDLRLEVVERAVGGDLGFVRWIAHGTRPDGTHIRFDGLDRLRVADGEIVENVILFDTARFRAATGFDLAET